MQWTVDPSSPVPIFEQIADSVRTGLSAGTLRPGARLPAAKDLADALDVNIHTVLKAYQVLRGERLLDLRRGRGAVVLDPPARPHLESLLDDLVSEARRLGLTAEDLTRLIGERHE